MKGLKLVGHMLKGLSVEQQKKEEQSPALSQNIYLFVYFSALMSSCYLGRAFIKTTVVLFSELC